MLNAHLMLVVLVLIGNAVVSFPQTGKTGKSLLEDQPHVDGQGNFYWSFSNPNGQTANQKGYTKNPGTPEATVAFQGAFSYFGKDGTLYLTEYTADEKGYRPKQTVVRLPGIVMKRIKS